MRIETDPLAFDEFLTDESNAHAAEANSIEAVLFPTEEAELAEAMRDACRRRKRVTVSGAGTGVTGARVPKSGGIVVSMSSMVNVRPREGWERVEYLGLSGKSSFLLDRAGCAAIVPPGIPLLELMGALPKAFQYPPDPTETSAQVGGTIATNASGARCFRYGATRAWVYGLRVVLANGNTLELSRGCIVAGNDGFLDFTSDQGREYRVPMPRYAMPSVKHNAGVFAKPGMDLVDLFIGSEGILGVVTEARLRLAERPKNVISDIAFFADDAAALKFADWLRPMRDGPMLAVEYFDGSALEFIREERAEVPSRAGAAIFFEMVGEGADPLVPFDGMLRELGAVEDWCACGERDVRDLKEFRHSLPDRVNAYLRERQSHKMGTDMAVPLPRFPEMMDAYRSAGERFRKAFPRHGAHHVLFGHVGDCHLHFNFLSETREELAMAKKLYLELAHRAVALGGTLSGEHGMGKKTLEVDGRPVPYIQLMYGEDGLRQIAAAKAAVDPDFLLNSGNIVPSPGATR
jgi:D-lactate dehydrogenase (cytochrome)